MDKESSITEINKEFTCSTKGCKKKCEEIWCFTQYGGTARCDDFLKGNSYCEDCFKKMEQSLK